MDLEGKPVVVVGLARSGIAAARHLAARGAHVVAIDRKGEEGLTAEAVSLRERGVELRLGGHDREALRNAALVVVSPGVPWNTPELVEARRHAEIIGELELGFRALRGTVVAITGTKGKTTTTVALGAMLARARSDVRVGGNIGQPLTELVDGATEDTVFVVETSSFQLQGTSSFRPKIAVYLNLSADHLDQHHDLEEYASAKARIFANQAGEDIAVVNAEDRGVLVAARSGRARLVPFWTSGAPGEGADGAWFAGSSARLRLDGRERTLFDRATVRVRGAHLATDLLAAAAAASLLKTPGSDIASAIAEYRGLEHVLEEVGRVGGATFVNDSKATNIEAARCSLESFAGPLVAILGGRHKGGDFADLGPSLRGRARAVVAIGEAADRIARDLGTQVSVVKAPSMDHAVEAAFAALGGEEGTVLLAPACSSFDMFRDYAERGRAFKEAVSRLASAEGGGAGDG